METKHIRSFEIENTQFSLNECEGLMCLISLHPYDEREYHWAARDTDGRWQVFKGSHFRMTLGRIAPESVAAKLLECDRAHRALLESLGI